MKKYFILFIFILSKIMALCQVQWTKYANNPVMKKQNLLTEFFAIGQPTVLIENDTFKLWYVGGGLPYVTSIILYAWSLDGIQWNKHNSGSAVMLPGNAGQWDVWMDTPEVFRDSYGYKLFYYGDTAGATGANPSSLAGIGVATSPDGINWTKFPANPVLSHGNPGDWDQHWIESPAVLFDSTANQYLMWYSGVDTSAWRIQIGLATSADGFSWTKYSGNPVLSIGNPGSYDDMWVSVPGVIKNADVFEMFYSTFSSVSGFSTIYLAYATSTNGVNWTKHPDNPLFSTQTLPYDSTVDSGGPWAPDIVFDPAANEYKLWYETGAGFCLATAPLAIGLSEQMNLFPEGFSIFPNPNKGKLIVETEGKVSIYDIYGGNVISREIYSGAELDLSALPNGIYFLIHETEKKIITKKIEILK